MFNSKGFEIQKFEIDINNAKLVNMPSDNEKNRYQKITLSLTRSNSAPTWNPIGKEHFDFILKSHRSADDLLFDNHDLEMLEDNHYGNKKANEPPSMPTNCEMNPDPQIVPKHLEDALIENQPDLDPA